MSIVFLPSLGRAHNLCWGPMLWGKDRKDCGTKMIDHSYNPKPDTLSTFFVICHSYRSICSISSRHCLEEFVISFKEPYLETKILRIWVLAQFILASIQSSTYYSSFPTSVIISFFTSLHRRIIISSEDLFWRRKSQNHFLPPFLLAFLFPSSTEFYFVIKSEPSFKISSWLRVCLHARKTALVTSKATSGMLSVLWILRFSSWCFVSSNGKCDFTRIFWVPGYPTVLWQVCCESTWGEILLELMSGKFYSS